MKIVEIGNFIQRERGRRKMSRSEMGKLLGMSANTIYKLENGTYTPSLATLQWITDQLECEFFIIPKGE